MIWGYHYFREHSYLHIYTICTKKAADLFRTSPLQGKKFQPIRRLPRRSLAIFSPIGFHDIRQLKLGAFKCTVDLEDYRKTLAGFLKHSIQDERAWRMYMILYIVKNGYTMTYIYIYYICMFIIYL